MVRKLSALLIAVLLVSLVTVPQASAALPPKPTPGDQDVTGNFTGKTGLLDWNGPYLRLLGHMTDQWAWPDWSEGYTAVGEQVDISALYKQPASSKVVTVHDAGVATILINQYGKAITPAPTEADFPNAVIFPDAQPGIRNGRILAPIRFLFENMGYTVTWTEDKPNLVEVTGKGHDIQLFIGETRAVVDGQDKTLDVAPTIWDGRTYLPLRFLFESVGAVVGWQANIRAAWIWTDPNDPSLQAAKADPSIVIGN